MCLRLTYKRISGQSVSYMRQWAKKRHEQRQWFQQSKTRKDMRRKEAMQVALTWNSMGAKGLQAGVDASVADLRIAVPRPPMAITLPAGTCCSRSSPLPIIKYKPSTCMNRQP